MIWICNVAIAFTLPYPMSSPAALQDNPKYPTLLHLDLLKYAQSNLTISDSIDQVYPSTPAHRGARFTQVCLVTPTTLR